MKLSCVAHAALGRFGCFGVFGGASCGLSQARRRGVQFASRPSRPRLLAFDDLARCTGALEAGRRLLHRVAHLAQLVELDLAVDVGLDVGDVALQPAGEVAERCARRAAAAPGRSRSARPRAITISSEKPMSNIGVLENKRAPAGAPLRLTGSWTVLRPCVSVLPLTSPSTVLPVTCGAACPASAALSPLFAHAVLEAAHRAAEIRADVAQLLRAENHQHDDQQDDPVPDAPTCP